MQRHGLAMVAPTPGMFSVDGSTLEGGGQVVRMSSALSALLGVAIHVDRIRAGRSKPGLAAQHAAGIHLVAAMCSGQLTGGEIGSTSLTLRPGPILLGGARRAECGTAGAVTLLLQSSLPLCCFPPRGSSGPVSTRLELCGGTDVSFAPPVDYARHVLLPVLHTLFGVQAKIDVKRRGFYPRGGGEIHVEVEAATAPLKPFHLVERGRITRICGVAVSRAGEVGGGGGGR
ncbi:RNA 3'-terminal phosphate cyclase domain-containing protein, partial [Baffinella frigidus]